MNLKEIEARARMAHCRSFAPLDPAEQDRDGLIAEVKRLEVECDRQFIQGSEFALRVMAQHVFGPSGEFQDAGWNTGSAKIQEILEPRRVEIREARPRAEGGVMAGIDDKPLKALCREFRKGMLDRMSSKGKCAMVSWALQGFLSFSMKLQTEVYQSDVGPWNHIWLKLPDGRVLDCTADQFNKRGKRPKYPQIYIGAPLDIHAGGKPYN